MRVFLNYVSISVAALLVLSFVGALHPIGDSFAVGRLPLALTLAMLVWGATFSRWLQIGLTLLGLASAGQILVPMVARQTASDFDFVLYQQNLLYNRAETEAWLAEIDRQAPQFMTLQEVSEGNASLLRSLGDEFPAQLHCNEGRRGGVAVLSVYEVINGTPTCAVDDAVAAMQVNTPHGPVWIVSIHLSWPWPFGQAAQAQKVARVIEQLDGHKILAGDFNSVRWAYAIRRIAQVGEVGYVGPSRPTFRISEILPVGIDHVMTSPAYAQEVIVMPKLGSDHNGVLARLTRPRDE